ncbi:ABC transporter permease [Lacticaseibacillus baoqingensis]|uniref:ABC transporter permease n=1 Tax=Lacticaseibacillus baoqingensis TaxID=2486013 RepID=A0ABW4E7F9_9LACO
MGTLVKQELYKLVHKRGTWLALVFMVLVQVGFAVMRQIYPKMMTVKDLAANEYIGGLLVLFIMIASTASIIAMEFQYGTIKQLLYRQYYRSQVFISKLIVLIMQLIGLQAIATGMTFGLTAILAPNFDWQQAVGTSTFWHQYWLGLAGNALVAALLLSVVLLLATWFKSNAAAIAAGFIGYFVLQVASTLLLVLISRWEWLKWNPFTMLLVGQQLTHERILAPMTHLETPIMALCTGGYALLFTLIAYLSFRKRSV